MKNKGFRYFTRCKDDYDDGKIIPLCIMLPKRLHIKEILIKLNIYFFIKDNSLGEK